MWDFPVHVVDFEGGRASGVVEYGVATLGASGIEAARTAICAPEGEITARERAEHGLSEAAARSGAPFSEAWPLFAELRQTGPFAAHNAAVEDGFLRRYWPYPRVSPRFCPPGGEAASWGPWIDTLFLYRAFYPRLGSHRLQELIDLFHLRAPLETEASRRCPTSRRRFHAALYDALASALLLERLRRVPELAEALDAERLFAASAPSAEKREAMEQGDLFA